MNHPHVLLKSARVIDPNSPYHLKQCDVLLADGKITAIAEHLDTPNEAIEVKSPNLHLSLGWIELRANFNDPGNEDRETLETGAAAALRGGFTAVALNPQTDPVVDQKAAVEYLRSRSNYLPVRLLPIGAFSKNLAGEELSEIYDMQKAGAQAFSHGYKSVANSALMRLALLYHRDLNQALQVLSYDAAMTAGGQMHEGSKSTWLGLKGIPDLAESLSMSRDIALAEYCESSIHFQGVSTKRGLDLIQDAQARGIAVSGDVNLLNLIWNDEALESYDSKLKVYPPLRSEEDRQALLQAIKDGSLKGIASDHRPRTIEEKRCEFDLALFGAATIEASFALLNTHLQNELGLERIISILSQEHRSILNYNQKDSIQLGAEVDLTIFDPTIEWQWENSQAKSKAANYPFQGQTFKGKAIATFCKGKWQACEA